jgi:NitT/TauT family transport system ATP-binding protein
MRVATADAAGISATSVTKIFYDINRGDEVVALREFSLTVEPNEFIAIVGPSGCGKSTFLNIVAGFEHPTAGQVTLNGRAITDPGPDRGVVFQDYALFPWLTVQQNVEFGLRYQPISPRERKTVVRELIGLVQLEHFEHRFPRELSGGMKQRVALARVLATNPQILLMDEPFGSLDALTRHAMQKQLLEVWKSRQTTVLLVTHSVDEAIYLADRIVALTARPGRILEILEVKETRPRNLASEASNKLRGILMNLMEGEVTKAVRDAEDHPVSN